MSLESSGVTLWGKRIVGTSHGGPRGERVKPIPLARRRKERKKDSPDVGIDASSGKGVSASPQL